jgi:S1-C subfamily serine protease
MQSGSSGGAVFNSAGEIVGMSSLGAEGVQEAIPINGIKQTLK